MTIKSRIKKIRLTLGLNQTDFGARISVAQTYLSQLEKGDREITEKIFRLICLEFNVNEEWLRNGNGDMFVEDDHGILSQLAAEYNLSDIEKKIIRTYLGLSETNRKKLVDFGMFFANEFAKQNSPDIAATIAARPFKNDHNLTREEKESMMKRQLDAEEKDVTSSVSTFINGSDGEKMA